MTLLRTLTVTTYLLATTATMSANAGTVTLQNGDQIKGTITEKTDEGVTLEHKTLGTMTLEADQVKGVAFSNSDPAYEGGNGGMNGWFFPGWDKSLEAGFSGTDGNSETLNVYAAFNTKHEDDTDRWDIKANYFLATDEGAQTRNEGEIGLVKDWLIPGERYFYFGLAKYEHDRFTGWTDRTSGFLGVGYELIKEDDLTLNGRLGAGGNYEAGEVNEFTPEALVGADLTWKIDSNQTFTAYNNFYPSLDPAFSDFRNVSGAAYKVKVSAGRGMSLKLGVENEYISDPAPGTESNDLKYFGALVYDF